MSSRRYTGTADHVVVSPSLSFGDENGLVSSGRADPRHWGEFPQSGERGCGGCVCIGWLLKGSISV